jgi:hypothetical protein
MLLESSRGSPCELRMHAKRSICGIFSGQCGSVQSEAVVGRSFMWVVGPGGHLLIGGGGGLGLPIPQGIGVEIDLR